MTGDLQSESILARLESKAIRNRLVGNSPSFRVVLRNLDKMAESGVPVLIEGETGTGKELLGRAIHYLSRYAEGPFIAINCATLQDSLIENELFGHEAGAYTDAQRRNAGLFGLAEGGTLFLDEVDALSQRGQRVLLRTLQERAYRPVGGGREKSFHARILAASNSSLRRLAEAGRFRSDLLFRLNVLFLWLPPLRERSEDLQGLVGHFLHKYAREDGSVPRLTQEAWGWLRRQKWPGNIRELENAILRAIHLAGDEAIDAHHLAPLDDTPRGTIDPPPGGEDAVLPSGAAEMDPAALGSYQDQKKRVLERFEVEYLVHLMRLVRGNVTHASLLAKKERRDLGRLLKKHGIAPRSYFPAG